MKRKTLEKIKKTGKIAVYVIAGFALAWTGVCVVLRVSLKDYYKNSRVAFEIPDISKGFIPQGISYDAGTECFFLTGYMDNFKPSPIYAVDAKNNEMVGKILMQTETGKKFKGHAGGISIYGRELCVAGSTDACMYTYSIPEILNSRKGNFLKAESRVDLKTDDDFIRVSFTSYTGDLVFAGEFRKDPIFYTHDSHWVDEQGEKQKAYLFGFNIDDANEAVPECVYSVPDNIQGACFDEEYVYLSQSHGLFPSKIYAYKLDNLVSVEYRKVLGKDIPLYVLTEKNASKITKVPPMSEEIVVKDKLLYILHESASNRYMIGKFLGQKKVRSTPVSYFRD